MQNACIELYFKLPDILMNYSAASSGASKSQINNKKTSFFLKQGVDNMHSIAYN